MSSPDFRTFVDTLSPGHTAWLAANPNLAASPNGGDLFFQHYVGDPLHQDGLFWQYEAWRFEHGYTRVRPWDGAETLGRTPTADIPSPGFIYPWFPAASAGPSIDPRLTDGRTTANLQADFGVGNTNALGLAILAHWNAVHTFSTMQMAARFPISNLWTAPIAGTTSGTGERRFAHSAQLRPRTIPLPRRTALSASSVREPTHPETFYCFIATSSLLMTTGGGEKGCRRSNYGSRRVSNISMRSTRSKMVPFNRFSRNN